METCGGAGVTPSQYLFNRDHKGLIDKLEAEKLLLETELRRLHSIDNLGISADEQDPIWSDDREPIPTDCTIQQLVQHSQSWSSLRYLHNFFQKTIREINILEYTGRICAWVINVMGMSLLDSKWERAMRVVEEVIELGQSCGLRESDISKLVQRVYSRSIGDPKQEAGGVMVTLIALASTCNINLISELKREVERIEKIDPEIVRKKQYEKYDANVGMKPEHGEKASI